MERVEVELGDASDAEEVDDIAHIAKWPINETIDKSRGAVLL
jgi:hypothetical protein